MEAAFHSGLFLLLPYANECFYIDGMNMHQHGKIQWHFRSNAGGIIY